MNNQDINYIFIIYSCKKNLDKANVLYNRYLNNLQIMNYLKIKMAKNRQNLKVYLIFIKLLNFKKYRNFSAPEHQSPTKSLP